jgi:hypothetical protein
MRQEPAIDSPLADPRAELTRLRSFTIWQALNVAAADDPEHSALVGASDAGDIKRLTYAQLLRRVRDLSAGLAGGIVANAVLHSGRMGVNRSDVYFNLGGGKIERAQLAQWAKTEART